MWLMFEVIMHSASQIGKFELVKASNARISICEQKLFLNKEIQLN